MAEVASASAAAIPLQKSLDFPATSACSSRSTAAPSRLTHASRNNNEAGGGASPAIPSLTVDKTEVVIGQNAKVTMTWNIPVVTLNDWIGLFPSGRERVTMSQLFL